MRGVVGEIKAALKGKVWALSILQTDKAGTNETFKLLAVGRLGFQAAGFNQVEQVLVGHFRFLK